MGFFQDAARWVGGDATRGPSAACGWAGASLGRKLEPPPPVVVVERGAAICHDAAGAALGAPSPEPISMAVLRERIDVLVVQRGLAPSRALAQALVMEGRVTVEGRRVDKPGTRVDVAA